MKKICVLGLGYIGLPTASVLATHGHRVLGFDVNPDIARTLNEGKIHIQEPGLRILVQAALRSGNMTVHPEPQPADVFIIAVPTPIVAGETKLPSADLGAVRAATQAAVPHLRAGNLVVLESTSPPGTTAKVVVPILEQSGLKAGKDFHVAYCPERVLPGHILDELVVNDRIIGGIDQESAQAARELYATFVQGQIFLTNATTAEMVKLMENTYRDVNIALANEMAMIAEDIGVDVWEAISLANRHPRVKILRPGPGVGGHCIAVDPWFLVEAAPAHSQLIRNAREVNDQMPRHVAKIVQRELKDIPNPVIAIFGLAYKGNVDDARESPAIHVIEELEQLGYALRLNDPHVRATGRFNRPLVETDAAVSKADCILVLADHNEYSSLDIAAIASQVRHRLVIDTRHCLDLRAWQAAGFKTILLGAETAHA